MQPTLGVTALLDRQSDRRAKPEHISGLLTEAASRFFVLAGGKPVVNSNEERTVVSLRWFERGQLEDLKLPVEDAIFLGVERTSGGARFAVHTTEHFARHAPGGKDLLHPFVDLRTLASQGAMAHDELGLVGQAAALSNWHANTRCCGRCGGSMSTKDGGWKRRCWSCKHEEFPRMDPVVIMAVTDGERLVLAHEDRFPVKMYSAIAGYVEPGDDIVHAVLRETKEEVGLDVADVRIINAQPWPFEHNLMIGCIARAPGDALKVDSAELEDARWFTREDVKHMKAHTHADGFWIPGEHSIAFTLITEFLEGRT